MTESASRGRFVWYDLMTPEPEAAIAFYTALLGWGTTSMETGHGPYTLWTRGEAPLGGIMQLPKEASEAGAPPHWLAYVSVPDCHATAAQAKELGGSVMVPPTEIPDIGHFTVLQDPQGVVIAAYTHGGSQAPAPESAPQVGEFSWHELLTTDHEAALEFYGALFGWQKGEGHDMGPMGTYQLFGPTEVPVGGMFSKTPEMPMPPFWMYYVRVEDVHKSAEKVQELGGKILNGPMEVPGGDWVVQCMDPQGGAFALHQSAS